MTELLGFIPSPSEGTIELGPIGLHAYGLFIGLGVLAAVSLGTRQWVRLGGHRDDVTLLALVGVPAGIIGARLYHLATDWQLYRDEPWRALFIWDGGLGIWGGIAGGVGAGLLLAHRKGWDKLALIDIAAPALLLAQAIGRVGNYFNQELFGRPTEVPWALRIDWPNRPPGYEQFATFHPTFAYEALWNLALCAFLVWAGPRLRLRKGNLFALYVAGYTFARFFIEGLRIDVAHHLLGLRINQWTSVIVFIAALTVLGVRQYRFGRQSKVGSA